MTWARVEEVSEFVYIVKYEDGDYFVMEFDENYNIIKCKKYNAFQKTLVSKNEESNFR